MRLASFSRRKSLFPTVRLSDFSLLSGRISTLKDETGAVSQLAAAVGARVCCVIQRLPLGRRSSSTEILPCLRPSSTSCARKSCTRAPSACTFSCTRPSSTGSRLSVSASRLDPNYLIVDSLFRDLIEHYELHFSQTGSPPFLTVGLTVEGREEM